MRELETLCTTLCKRDVSKPRVLLRMIEIGGVALLSATRANRQTPLQVALRARWSTDFLVRLIDAGGVAVARQVPGSYHSPTGYERCILYDAARHLTDRCGERGHWGMVDPALLRLILIAATLAGREEDSSVVWADQLFRVVRELELPLENGIREPGDCLDYEALGYCDDSTLDRALRPAGSQPRPEVPAGAWDYSQETRLYWHWPSLTVDEICARAQMALVPADSRRWQNGLRILVLLHFNANRRHLPAAVLKRIVLEALPLVSTMHWADYAPWIARSPVRRLPWMSLADP